MCKTGSAAGKRAGAKSNTVRRRSNHARTEDQAGREKRANTDASGGWRVHTAVDTPRRNAATRSKHLSFMCQGDMSIIITSHLQGEHVYTVWLIHSIQCKPHCSSTGSCASDRAAGVDTSQSTLRVHPLGQSCQLALWHNVNVLAATCWL